MSSFSKWLSGRPLYLSGWCIVAAFGTYFCMYGFRKPFTAGAYTDFSFLDIGFKTVLVTSQVIGYMLSKFIGVKVVSELSPSRRALGILGCVVFAELALLGFGLVPPPYNFLFLFLNGLPLGMVFGMVLGFLEGRTVTEALVAGLCASFILADGVTKSVGTYLLKDGVPEMWMPFAAGLVFGVPMMLFIWMLTQIPPPNAIDVKQRGERAPMNRDARRDFVRRHGIGLTGLLVTYLLVTIIRSMRADYAPEIWKGLGYASVPSLYTKSELWVLLGVTLVNGITFAIRDSRRAFFTSLGIAMFGCGIVIASFFVVESGMDGFAYMVMVGLGLYVPYVAMHTTVFERLIAMTRDRGNIGFLLTLADAIGYLGYVGVMISREIWGKTGDVLGLFRLVSFGVATASLLLLAVAWTFFGRRQQQIELAAEST
ncbi:DUF5690 family protein [Zavarzinella formosa]|uniref:DUF5690 family protein n=1 Tax=Zavarzinella formosa TaxID=360055 RepID=UPI00036D6847|nr:DUF5690 family protein [Zavarzinella formosa]